MEGMQERDVTSVLSKPSGYQELSGTNSVMDTKRKDHMSTQGGDKRKDSIHEISLETNRNLGRRSEARPLRDSIQSGMNESKNETECEKMEKAFEATYEDLCITHVSEQEVENANELEVRRLESEPGFEIESKQINIEKPVEAPKQVVVDQEKLAQQLTEVIFENDLNQLKELLAQGLDKELALLKICQFSEDTTELINHVLCEGASINTCDRNGRTPLHFGCKRQKLNLVRVMLEQKDIQVDMRDNGGETALMKAVTTHNLTLLKMILNEGANPVLTNGLKQSCLTLSKLESDDEETAEIIDLLTESVAQWRQAHSDTAINNQEESPEASTFEPFLS